MAISRADCGTRARRSNGLDDDFDILALLMGGAKERQVASPASIRRSSGLENHQHPRTKKAEKPGRKYCSTTSFSK